MGKWLQVRSDDEFLDLVDRLAAESVPPLSRSNLIRKLVIEADRKARKARVSRAPSRVALCARQVANRRDRPHQQ